MSEVYDFVIVGSGGGSMCAALVLRAAGKSVLVLEKAPLVGGTTAVSGGVMWIPNNRFMKEAGVADSPEQAVAYLDAAVGDDPAALGASKARRQAYVAQAPEMLEFLISQGLKFRRIPEWPDFYSDLPGGSQKGRTVVSQLFDVNQLGAWKAKLRPGFLPLPANLDEAFQLAWIKRSGEARKTLGKVIFRAIGALLKGKRLVTAGNALQAQLLDAALKAGVEVRTEAPVKKLIVKDERVCGVVAEANGAETPIEARLGVLINAGGFARNQAMLDEYIPGTSAEWTAVPEGDTGDLIKEGVRIGAAIAQMGERVGMPVALTPDRKGSPPGVQNDMGKPHAIIVDQEGVRYTNESASYDAFCRAQRARAKAVPSWLIMDSQFLGQYMLAGTQPGKKPKAWLEGGFLKSGETLAELAQSCNLPADALAATVERFNRFAKAGKDEDFGRGDSANDKFGGDPEHGPNPCLGALEQGPFYALQVYPGDVSTFGGLVTDEWARVLRPDGSAIAGLYATGTSTASVFGSVEPGPGGSVGPSFTWGFVAAKHALNRNETLPV